MNSKEILIKQINKYQNALSIVMKNKNVNSNKSFNSENICENLVVIYNDSISIISNINKMIIFYKRNVTDENFNNLKNILIGLSKTYIPFVSLFTSSIMDIIGKFIHSKEFFGNIAYKKTFHFIQQYSSVNNKLDINDQVDLNKQLIKNIKNLITKEIDVDYYKFIKKFSEKFASSPSDAELQSKSATVLQSILTVLLDTSSIINKLLEDVNNYSDKDSSNQDRLEVIEYNMEDIINYLNNHKLIKKEEICG